MVYRQQNTLFLLHTDVTLECHTESAERKKQKTHTREYYKMKVQNNRVHNEDDTPTPTTDEINFNSEFIAIVRLLGTEETQQTKI